MAWRQDRPVDVVHYRLDLFDEPDDLLGRELVLAHISPRLVNGLYRLSIGTVGGEQVMTRDHTISGGCACLRKFRWQ